ncbi:MAG: leucyl aminopeptidase [Phycisphaeraceae bacterium]
MYQRITIAASRVARPDAVAVTLFASPSQLPQGYRQIDRDTGGALSALLKRHEFAGERGEVLCLYPAAGPAERLYVLGLGERRRFTGETLRVAAAKLARSLHGAQVTSLRLMIDDIAESDLVAAKSRPGYAQALLGRAMGDGLSIGNFQCDQFKGTAAKKATGRKPDKPSSLTVELDPRYREPAQRGLDIGESVNLCRGLQATPPNIADPAYIVAQCKKLAKQVGLSCRVIDAKKAAQLGMNGLLAVGAAGSSPPALIALEWKPKAIPAKLADSHGRALIGKIRNPTASTAAPAAKSEIRNGPVLLVGKAVTFDTGGYSIKPAENMDKMKYDKSGGMAVIGAMHALAHLKLPLHVVGLIPVAENLVSDAAYRPGDILTLYNGVTVEVTNTDAEGRLILADALAYGCKTYRPDAVIDLATLTGGVVVTFGTLCAGLFTTERKLRSSLFDAADFTGERVGHLPLWEEHRELLKGTHGDLVNSAGREAHPIQGAAFLSHFVSADGKGDAMDHPPAGGWAHLDIAGMADVKKDTPLYPSGPTGYGVRLLVRWMEARCGEK